MNIKVTPHFASPGLPTEEETAEFKGYIGEMMELGFSMKLLHYADGSVILNKMTNEELEMLSTKHG